MGSIGKKVSSRCDNIVWHYLELGQRNQIFCRRRVPLENHNPRIYRGSSTESHSVSLSLGSGGVSSSDGYLTTAGGEIYAQHTHGFGTTASSSVSTKPLRVQLRHYQVSSLTNIALAGSIVFMDGQPSNNWSIASYDSCFVESQNSDATITGSSTHNHTGQSITPAASTQGYKNTQTPQGSITVAAPHHTHSPTFDLDTQNHEPPYVNLVPAQLNTTLCHSVIARAQIICLY